MAEVASRDRPVMISSSSLYGRPILAACNRNLYPGLRCGNSTPNRHHWRGNPSTSRGAAKTTDLKAKTDNPGFRRKTTTDLFTIMV
jgi:hypothetical protein